MRFSQFAIAAIFLTACGDKSSSDKSTESSDQTENAAQSNIAKVEDKAKTPEDTPTVETSTKSTWPKVEDGIPDIEPIDTVTTKTGLKISYTHKTEGAAVAAGDLVAVHYHGWLADGGKLFDSSGNLDPMGNPRQPIAFPVGQKRVIAGWDEGVSMLKIGEKARLEIPYELAYGEKGRPPKIPAKSVLVFDVWLVDSFPAPTAGIPEIDESSAETSPTGLVKIIINEGSGELVGSKVVSAHYAGWLAKDGSLFDTSVKRGQPLRFPVGVGQVIPGWDEGISGMRVGEKARFRIPSKLAYGERAMGDAIPANSDLVFDVWVMDARAMRPRKPTGHP